ncbi:hypothetical protein [Mycobacterium lepromatosis]|nr:hypothetical protein [Mycobacterium lepromatosis]
MLKSIARVGCKQFGTLDRFVYMGSYVEVVIPSVLRSGDSVRIARLKPS